MSCVCSGLLVLHQLACSLLSQLRRSVCVWRLAEGAPQGTSEMARHPHLHSHEGAAKKNRRAPSACERRSVRVPTVERERLLEWISTESDESCNGVEECGAKCGWQLGIRGAQTGRDATSLRASCV